MLKARSPARNSSGERDVFLNCPFDPLYKPLFQAIVFAVFACGFRARCALEVDNGGAVRFETIVSLIGQCRLGVHDLSRTDLSAKGSLPRFNMALELGLFLGAMRFGSVAQVDKRCLILDRERDRYRDFISDLAGQEIKAHGDRPDQAISAVREFLRASTDTGLPGGAAIAGDY